MEKHWATSPTYTWYHFALWKLYAKLHILIIRSFIVMYYWVFCFAVWTCTNKNPTPDFLRVEEIQKLDGDMTQNFFVFVCFQGRTVSLIVSSQPLPCIWIKGLRTSFHLPDNQMNNYFDCLEVTKAPDAEFINPYPLPIIINFLWAEQLNTSNYQDPLCLWNISRIVWSAVCSVPYENYDQVPYF